MWRGRHEGKCPSCNIHENTIRIKLQAAQLQQQAACSKTQSIDAMAAMEKRRTQWIQADCTGVPSRPWSFHGVHRVEAVRKLRLGMQMQLHGNPFIALSTLAAAAILGTAVWPAAAQNYPVRPVRIVIAFGPGGIADTIGRLVGQKLGDRFGQTIVGDNRPGAGGALAARIVAAATPDGHTLLVTTAIAVNATSVRDAVDPRTQLTPVAIAATAPTIFVVHRSVTAKSLLDYLRTAKKGRFNYGTAGVGTSEHSNALIRLMRVSWTPAFAGVTSHRTGSSSVFSVFTLCG
jgi:hypothetical protein